jgi:mRNA interferase MazF
MSVARWSIWLANLDPVVGSEQGKTRPVLVISDTRLNDILPVVNVLPLTSRKPGRRIYPNEAGIPVGAWDWRRIQSCSVIKFAHWTSAD